MEGIKQADGYNYNVHQVTKRIMRIDEVPASPTISVVVGPTAKRPSDETGHALYRATTTFQCIGYLKTFMDPSQEGTMIDEACDLQEDIEEALLVDSTLVQTPTASGWQVSIVSEPPFVDYENRFAEVQVVVVIDYYHTSDV
jgi:hypothetical protein